MTRYKNVVVRVPSGDERMSHKLKYLTLVMDAINSA